jgi:hypothetical protein
MVRVLPLNPQPTFLVQAADAVFRAHGHCLRPGGSRFWSRRASRLARRVSRSSAKEEPSREVPSRLRVRQTGKHGS